MFLDFLMMLHQRDLFDDPIVTAASVSHECLAADEELRGSFSYNLVRDS